MQKSVFHVAQMDCPSEENLIRMKLEGIEGIKRLDFDLTRRTLSVWHQGEGPLLESALASLQLGSKLLSREQVEELTPKPSEEKERALLWAVLAINAAFFLIEMLSGLLADSMGLVADSLDMLADALVYGLSLWAVGGAVARKKRIARLAGYFQLTLAVSGFAEVVRRFLGMEAMPDFTTMMVVSALALLANSFCLYLLQKARNKEAHMQASMIFTSNDILINLGVILAGALVHWLNSSLPDLIVGALVFLLVVRGAIRILKLGR